MYPNSCLSAPFLFNAAKHHIGFVKEFIDQSRSGGRSIEDINHQLISIGKSVIDIYYGSLTQIEIAQEILNHLKVLNFYDLVPYRQFISPQKYKTLKLSDGSGWTLIMGKIQESYIHIHPSRGSLHTIRARALALKTAILLMIFYSDKLKKVSKVELVNEVRGKYLGESPIKNEIYTKGVNRVLDLL